MAMADVIVIGKGPAGISAAVYMARAGLQVLCIGKGAGLLERAELIENYYGFREPISGKELLANGIAQAQRLGVNILSEEVISIDKEESFLVKTTEATHTAKAVLLATGKARQGVRIKGFEELRGKGLSFCATCDGFFYRGKRLAVIGSGDYAAEELAHLQSFTKDITLFTNGAPLTTTKLAEGISVIAEPITEILGVENDRVSGIATISARYDFDGIFVAIGTASAADFAAKIGVMLNGGDIAVDEGFMTNVEGLYAAGDCIGGYLQVSKAVGDGAVASRSIIQYVKQLKA